MKAKRNDRLFVGPIIGELGHELMCAGAVRAYSRKFKHATVCSRPGSAALYADFADVFLAHTIDCEGTDMGGYRVDAKSGDITREMATYVPKSGYTVWNPAPHPPGEHAKMQPAEWFVYGHERPEFKGAVVFHARARAHDAKRNWPADKWGQLTAALNTESMAGRFICIGTKKDALYVPGTEDMRGADLQTQMDVLRSARFAVGPSSGPLHLAQHCLCPVVVWCGGEEAEETVSKYKALWNPHGIGAFAVVWRDWQPTVADVLAWIRSRE